MGRAIFYNPDKNAYIEFKGTDDRTIFASRVDNSADADAANTCATGFSMNLGGYAAAARCASDAAMPSRKALAAEFGKAAELIRDMRREGYSLAKPGSVEYAMAAFTGASAELAG